MKCDRNQYVFLLGLAALPMPVVSCSQMEKLEHPNILFVSFDDMRPEWGAYGVGYMHTPNLDEFSREAFTFDRAYCQQSVSGASRASLMTGFRPDSSYVLDNDTHIRSVRPEVVTLPQYFKKNGYHAVQYGKIFHGHMGQWNDSRSWSEFWFYPECHYTNNLFGYLKPENVEYINTHCVHGNMRYYLASSTEAEDVGDEAYPDGQTTEAFIANLPRFREMNRRGKPVFMAFGIEKPHLPFCAPKKYWDLYDRDEIELPEATDYPEGYPEMAGMDYGEIRPYYDIPKKGKFPLEKSKELIHGYRACVSYADALFGKVIDALKKQGMYENTIIILWGDHGWKLGDFGAWCKLTNYEIDTRVPMMIRVPGLADDGRRSSSIVELVDMYPSLCDLAGLKIPGDIQGISFKPVLEDEHAVIKPVAFSQFTRGSKEQKYNPFGKKYTGYAMRTPDYRYVRWIERSTKKIVAEELYDLRDSMTESVNLARNEDFASLLAGMREMYDSEIKKAYR